ncbi:MAG TPA: prolyl oligopeptidase family serine peptidase [Candidatus Binatia bacterium]|nr:prolyl oligopeptidase family serine peptidase [Candidatus Binatia bacterium]
MKRLALVVGLAALTMPHAARADSAGPPVARRSLVVDTTFGIRLEDPYRWMEEPDRPEFRTWLLEQGDYSRKRLDAIPGRAALARRLKELSFETSGPGSVERRGSKIFYLRVDSGSSLAKLVVSFANGAERVLVDPERVRGSDSVHVSIDNYSVSWDGALVAYNLAEGGSEVTRVHVIETATGSEKPDVVEHIWGQFPVVWLPDGSGFFYTQMADAGFRDPKVDPILGMRVRRHLLGTPAKQDPVFIAPDSASTLTIEPREFPIIDVPIGTRYAIAYCVGAHPEVRMYVAPLESVVPGKIPWQRVCEYEDRIGNFAPDTASLYLLSHKDAPNGRILRVSVDDPKLASAEEVVPQSERILTDMAVTPDGLYTLQTEAGVDHVYRIARGQKNAREIPLPLAGAAKGLDGALDEEGILFSLTGWTTPERYYRYLPSEGRVRDTGMGVRSPVDFSHIVAERVEVKSFDGTMVPLTILRRATARRDAGHPTLLSGYGAYGTSIRPGFSASRMAWLERGGILAYAHVRGGGEKGEAWHQAGRGANKKNAVGDFIACAEYLIAKRYTSPSHLAATGSSGGGPLVGGAIVRRPDLFAAAVLYNTVLNTVRFLHGTNGANQIPEMGSPNDEAGFRALVAMDPTLAVRKGTRYPAVLACVGLNDRRVSMWHSGKFVARLQASGTRDPVFLRVEPEAGHGVGTTRDQGVALLADTYSFLLWQFGDRTFAPSP